MLAECWRIPELTDISTWLYKSFLAGSKHLGKLTVKRKFCLTLPTQSKCFSEGKEKKVIFDWIIAEPWRSMQLRTPLLIYVHFKLSISLKECWKKSFHWNRGKTTNQLELLVLATASILVLPFGETLWMKRQLQSSSWNKKTGVEMEGLVRLTCANTESTKLRSTWPDINMSEEFPLLDTLLIIKKH